MDVSGWIMDELELFCAMMQSRRLGLGLYVCIPVVTLLCSCSGPANDVMGQATHASTTSAILRVTSLLLPYHPSPLKTQPNETTDRSCQSNPIPNPSSSLPKSAAQQVSSNSPNRQQAPHITTNHNPSHHPSSRNPPTDRRHPTPNDHGRPQRPPALLHRNPAPPARPASRPAHSAAARFAAHEYVP
jgi:hypothetical protein